MISGTKARAGGDRCCLRSVGHRGGGDGQKRGGRSCGNLRTPAGTTVSYGQEANRQRGTHFHMKNPRWDGSKSDRPRGDTISSKIYCCLLRHNIAHRSPPDPSAVLRARTYRYLLDPCCHLMARAPFPRAGPRPTLLRL